MDAAQNMAPEASRTSLRAWIKEGRVSVDSVVVQDIRYGVLSGQEISLGSKVHYAKGGIKILYEDSHLVVVDKPEGLLSVEAAFEKTETVHAHLKEKYRPRKVFVVHRLDQDTSGVMLFALTEKAYSLLKELFVKHDIDRCYTAIVQGELKEKMGTWKSYQFEDEQYVVRNTSDADLGKLAITHYEVMGHTKRFSRLDLHLETGRKNQIRVHCAEAGYPIAGDKKYGGGESPIKRLCLHARLLGFVHPITDKQMRFESPCPQAFDRLVPIGKR
jgi:tRNA pseudouridine32 synthase/23S rRNA pseudouridine746 synthase/23S rRNA pseudouridine1911/1915/1917 synthase